MDVSNLKIIQTLSILRTKNICKTLLYNQIIEIFVAAKFVEINDHLRTKARDLVLY